MGKKSKIGKERKDKFYHLAKESGYRARSAFKLIQLNRKYEFLQSAHVLVDLCAAPGGWMQVAVNHMPISSLVVGVDLVPIKPIRGCTSIVADITTEFCRQALRKEIKHLKVDVVLHDGAPNVGTSWAQDAFTQASLVLSSLKLATELLREGGTFVTKVFRSRDYQSLLWIFQQLFKKVESTKPVSSRNVSAEIFVVCLGFLAPARIDPKLLDPKYVFQELEEQGPVRRVDLVHPERQRRQREGYEDGLSTLYKSVAAEAFIESPDFLDLLATHTEITFAPGSELLSEPETTEDVRSLCKDLKVLGKSDFKILLRWRAAIVERREAAKHAAEEKEKGEDEEEQDDGSESDSEDSEKAMEDALSAQENKKKQLKRKVQKQKLKLRKRLAINANAGPDVASTEEYLFDLKAIKSKRTLEAVDDASWDEEEMAEEEEAEKIVYVQPGDVDAMEKSLEEQYERFKELKAGRVRRVRIGKRTKMVDTEENGEDVPDDQLVADIDPDRIPDESEEAGDGGGAQGNPLLARRKLSGAAALWFEQPEFAGVRSDSEEDVPPVIPTKKQAAKAAAASSSGGVDGDGEDGWESAQGRDADDSSEESSGTDEDDEEGDGANKTENSASREGLNTEGLALATHMVAHQKFRAVLESGFHRFAFSDGQLPSWFVEEEVQHVQPTLPVTKEMVEQIKAEQRAIDARPIKKVLQAKARKHNKTMRRMEKLKQKAESISENAMLTDREKAHQIAALYKKAQQEKKAEIKYVVAKKSHLGQRVRRNKGSGPVRYVDTRQKKEKRAQKAQDKRKGRK